MGYRKDAEGTRTTAVDRRAILRVSWVYAAFSSLWIISSDLLLYNNHGTTLDGLLVGAGKGLLFVFVSTALIHLFILRALRSTQSERDTLRQRLHEWSSHANDIILLFDEQGTVVEANYRAVASYGYSAEAFTSVTVFDLVERPPGSPVRWQEILDKGEARGRTLGRRAEGSIFPAEYSAKVIGTADGVLVQTIVRDITESEEAQQQIIRLKDLYAALSQTNHCITLATSREELFRTTCEIAVRFGHFKLAWIGLLDESGTVLEVVSSAGEALKYLDGLRRSIDSDAPLSLSASGRAVLSGQPVIFNRISATEPASAHDRREAFGIASTSAFPLYLGGKPVGVLSLYSETADYFTADLASLLIEMAQDISSAMDRMAVEAERTRLAAELVKSHAWIAGIINGTEDIVAAINPEMVLTLKNDAYTGFAAAFGFCSQLGKKVAALQPRLDSAWQRALEGVSIRCEWSMEEGPGTRHFESLFAPLHDQQRNVIGAFHVGRDITRHKQMQLELRKLRTAIEQSPATVVITDIAGTIQYVNPAFTSTTGYTAEEVLGGNPRILKSGEKSQQHYAAMWNQLLKGEPWAGTFQNKRKDGSLFWEDAVIAPVRDAEGRITQFIAIKQDITQRREVEEHVTFLASHDPLTKLPNRLAGKEQMDKAIVEAVESRQKAALMFLDVDHFKRINDSLGHLIGDHLLQALVKRLGRCLRGVGKLSRHEGDEFLIVLGNVEDSGAILQLAEQIREQTSHPFQVDGFELSSTVSIGAAVYPDDGLSFEELHRHADLAMYVAKKAGRNTCQMYTTSMDTDAHEYLLILNGLQRAIDKQEFVLHYQPQIDLGSGRVTGAEALIRWQHPDLGLIPPGRFIAIAEDSGLIVEIGSWVIRECCRQARRWQEAGFQDLTVAANVSALQFRRGSLEDVVRDALEEAGLEPRFLELELTESILADDQAKAAAVLTRLHEIGVGLALDDFGTGYSSFTYLVNFKLDKLKIDQSFVRNISMNHKDETIVSSIVRLAREFGLRTVAEGVESEQALEVVRRAGCDQAQGFLFARPMIADDLLSFLRARRL